MQHLAIIPDGNRRWAKQNKLKSIMGHKKGLDAVKAAIEFCIKNGVKYLSIYTFSLENFRRSEEEKSYLFKLLVDNFGSQVNDFIKNQIKVKFLGDRSFFPEHIMPTINNVEDSTKDFDKLNLNLLFCYGGKAELVNAAKELAKKVKAGVLDIDQIDEDAISKHLWTYDVPDPDLVIRTSGLSRLSNFLLYQAAYSELMFLDCYWPEITCKHLEQCLDKFNKIKRNYGK